MNSDQLSEKPVYAERPRWKMWPVIIGAIVLLFIVIHEADRQGAVKAAAAKDAFVSDWNSGKLASADAFTARCGSPRVIDGNVLHYNSGGAGDFLVTVGPSARLELEHVKFRDGKAETFTTNVWPEQMFTELRCK